MVVKVYIYIRMYIYLYVYFWITSMRQNISKQIKVSAAHPEYRLDVGMYVFFPKPIPIFNEHLSKYFSMLSIKVCIDIFSEGSLITLMTVAEKSVQECQTRIYIFCPTLYLQIYLHHHF